MQRHPRIAPLKPTPRAASPAAERHARRARSCWWSSAARPCRRPGGANLRPLRPHEGQPRAW